VLTRGTVVHHELVFEYLEDRINQGKRRSTLFLETNVHPWSANGRSWGDKIYPQIYKNKTLRNYLSNLLSRIFIETPKDGR